MRYSLLYRTFGRSNREASQEIEESFTFGTPVIIHNFEPLQERDDTQNSLIAQRRVAAVFFHFLPSNPFEAGFNFRGYRSGDRTRRLFVEYQAPLPRAVGEHQRFQCRADIQIHHPRLLQRALKYSAAGEPNQHFVLLNKLLRHADIAMGKCRGVDGRNFLVPMPLLQIFAGQRAIDGYLPPGPATDAANISTHAGAMPSGPPNTANYTIHLTSIGTARAGRREWKQMRTNVFLKVVVEHDEKETPEKLAAELCRQLERNYIVRKAELLHYTGRED